ncbi:hypothetical protein HOY82DRAFT_652198 [Tuber indicum]|nr:hypothetical protein HOY82DRAFT_652198 [Tuber indicum]
MTLAIPFCFLVRVDPKFRKLVYSLDPTRQLLVPLTSTLYLFISNPRRPEAHAERLKVAKDEIVPSEKLYDEAVKSCGNIDGCVLGCVRFAPLIEPSVGPQGTSQDYTLANIQGSKIAIASFIHNAGDLGTQIAPDQFPYLMLPKTTSSRAFKYPTNRLRKALGYHPRRRDAPPHHLGPDRRSLARGYGAPPYHWPSRPLR